MLEPKEQRILELLQNGSQVSVSNIANELQVSLVTVRKILTNMENNKLVLRLHGSAILNTDNPDLVTHLAKQPVAKATTQNNQAQPIQHNQSHHDIAKKTVTIIPENQVIFCNGGQITADIIALLIDQNNVQQIITNNLLATSTQSDISDKLLFTGGKINLEQQIFYGDLATDTLRDIFADIAILNFAGISFDKGITSTFKDTAIINKLMIENTNGNVYAVMDSTCLDKVANFFTDSIDKINVIITDNQISEQQRKNIQRYGIELIIT